MAEISIIVPVYNTKMFVNRCIDSIINQTYSDFEVIIVDDGSFDGSGKICDEYAAMDKRISVIHQKNRGPACARNVALDWIFENSNCQWVTFIDSDDWVHPEYLRLLLQANITNETQISYTRLKTVFSECPEEELVSGASRTVKNSEGYIDTSGWVNSYACGGLFSKQLFESIRFPEGKLWEDLATVYKVIFQKEYMSVMSDYLYYYYVNPKSITKSQWRIQKLDEIEAYEKQLPFFERRDDTSLYVAVLNSYSKALYGQIRAIDAREDKELKPYRSALSKKLLRTIVRIIKLDRLYFEKNRSYIIHCLFFSNRFSAIIYDYIKQKERIVS